MTEPKAPPLWVAVGLKEVGVTEDTRPGKSNPEVEKYHAVTRAGSAPDDLAWCASFVSWCLEQAGEHSTRSKAAASYLTWGVECPPGTYGAVVVFGKHDPDAKGTGHVGFCLGVVGNQVQVLGGNQNNRVSIATRRVKDVVAWRWPAP